MNKKTLLTLLLGSALHGLAAPAFVDFAKPDTPTTLNAFLYIDGSPHNWMQDLEVFPNPASLVDGGSVRFQAPSLLGMGGLSIWLDIHDDNDPTPYLSTQAAITINNWSGAAIPVAANTLVFGVTGLYDRNGGTIQSVFNFVYAADEDIASYFTPSYDASTGTFSFTNSTGFSIANGSSLLFTGNFETAGSVIPEPSTYAASAGVLAVAFALWRKRRATSPTPST